MNRVLLIGLATGIAFIIALLLNATILTTAGEGQKVAARQATIKIQYSGSPISSPLSSTDLLIVTSPDLKTQADSLASFRNSQGISTMVKTTTEAGIIGQSGVDLQEKIRNYIIWAKNNLGITYVIIFGDEDQVPVRCAYIYNSVDGYAEVPTDLYYADLDGTWDGNGNGLWGEMDESNTDGIDGCPDLYIGRLPASNASEAQVLVDKIKTYEQNTSLNDAWFKRVLLIGTKMFGEYEGEILKDYIDDKYITTDYTTTKLYESDDSLNYLIGYAQISGQINDGCGVVNYAGHGARDRWYPGETEDSPWWYYATSNAHGLRNGSNLPVIFTCSCSTSEFDSGDECVGEAFMLNPDGGAIAYFGATRKAVGDEGDEITAGVAGNLDCRFSEKFFGGERIVGKVWGEAITDYINDYGITNYSKDGVEGYLDWWTVAEYSCPFMDPTLHIGGSRPIATTINTSGLASAHQATVHYIEEGVAKTATTNGAWSGMPDYNTSLSIDNLVPVSATEQYHSLDTDSWLVTGPTTHSLTYYHQWKPTISVITDGTGHTDLDSTNYAILTYYQYGSSETFHIFDAQSFSDWIDDGSTASLSNPSSGSTSTQRWYCPGTTSWVIDDASARIATYWEQFNVTIATVGLSASYPATIGITQYGVESNPTTSGLWSDWADAGSSLSIESAVGGGWFGKSWKTGDTTSWVINSPLSATVSYHRNYPIIYIIIGVAVALILLTFVAIRKRVV